MTEMDCLNEFKSVNGLEWKEVVNDQGTDCWKDQWFLDGETARVFNSEKGMEFYAGARYGEDIDHGVLWTKEVFSGDIKITYDYCRLDNASKCVNILYLLATGAGEEPYTKDIYEWADLRKVPSMITYINHMNTYHISYAAFGMDDSEVYIRARQYRSGEFEGTSMSPDYDPETLFAPMVPHKITAIIRGGQMYFHIQNEETEKICKWTLDEGNLLREGRIGLRQMFTRNARYSNLRISELT